MDTSVAAVVEQFCVDRNQNALLSWVSVQDPQSSLEALEGCLKHSEFSQLSVSDFHAYSKALQMSLSVLSDEDQIRLLETCVDRNAPRYIQIIFDALYHNTSPSIPQAIRLIDSHYLRDYLLVSVGTPLLSKEEKEHTLEKVRHWCESLTRKHRQDWLSNRVSIAIQKSNSNEDCPPWWPVALKHRDPSLVLSALSSLKDAHLRSFHLVLSWVSGFESEAVVAWAQERCALDPSGAPTDPPWNENAQDLHANLLKQYLQSLVSPTTLPSPKKKI